MGEALKPPIFLLGNVRSGTSMMHDLFDLHPQVASWYEPRTVWVYADPGRQHDYFDESDATERVKRYIRKRFLRYQREHGGLRIMEKTPSNILRIPYVRAIFPESKYVYMVREPLANLSSSEIKWRAPITLKHAMGRFWLTPKLQLPYYVGRLVRDTFRSRVLKRKHVSVWGVRYRGIYDDLKRLTPEEVIAKQWVACSVQAIKDIARLPKDLVLHLRYEDFVSDPVAHFTQICEHFDLPMTKRIEDALRSTVDAGRQHKWRRLDPSVLPKCLPILQEEMQRYGYSVPSELDGIQSETHCRE